MTAESLQLVSAASLWISNTSSSFLFLLIQFMRACMLSPFSQVHLYVTPWTVACQAPLSMGFSRQEYCGKLPYPPWRDLPNSGIKPAFPVAPALQVDSLPLSHQGSLRQPVRDFKKPNQKKKKNHQMQCMLSTNNFSNNCTILFFSTVFSMQGLVLLGEINERRAILLWIFNWQLSGHQAKTWSCVDPTCVPPVLSCLRITLCLGWTNLVILRARQISWSILWMFSVWLKLKTHFPQALFPLNF